MLIFLSVILQCLLALSVPAPAGLDLAVVIQGGILLSILVCGMWRSALHPTGGDFDQRTILLYSALLGYFFLRALFDVVAQEGSAMEFIRHTASITVPGACFLPWLFTFRRGSLSRLMIWSALPGLLQLMLILGVQTFVGSADDGAQAAIQRITLIDPRTTQTGIVFLFGLLATCAVIPSSRYLRFSSATGCAIMLIICMATLMRSMLLILGCQLVVAVLCSILSHGVGHTLRKLAPSVVLAAFASVFAVAAVPRFHASIDAFVERVSTTDLGEGRVNGEWDIALSQFAHAADDSLSTALFGFGPRFSFESSFGDARAYLHNLELFWLIFYGIVGATIGCGLLYVCSVRVVRNCRGASLSSCYVACCWFGLLAYAQVFAVHKLVLYNVQFATLVVVISVSVPGVAPRKAKGPGSWQMQLRRRVLR